MTDPFYNPLFDKKDWREFQLNLFDEEELKELQPKLMAIYFVMGQYNEDDDVPKKWIGLDCPFSPVEDPSYGSLVVYANSPGDLQDKIETVWEGESLEDKGATWDGWDDGDLAGTLPEVICDIRGKLDVRLMKLAHGKKYNPKSDMFSHGRENVIEFWKREKWKFV